MYKETPRDIEIATIIIDQMNGPDFLKDSIKMEHCWVIEGGVGMLCKAGGKVIKNFGYMPFPLKPYGFRVEVQLDEIQDLYRLSMQKVWHHKDCDKYIHSEEIEKGEGIYCDMLYPMVCNALGHKVDKDKYEEMLKRMTIRIETEVKAII